MGKLSNRLAIGAPQQSRQPREKESGIALFMVVAAMTVLSVLVTEFTYVAQVNNRMAFDGLDQVKALYLAKTGFKISLLRLKAYQIVKDQMSGSAMAGMSKQVPQSMIDKIWSFPFYYPIPTNIPGMTLSQKDSIEKFQKDSNLDGKFSAVIESESSRMNLNMILSPLPSPTTTQQKQQNQQSQQNQQNQPGQQPSPAPSFDPAVARQALSDFIGNLLTQKFEADSDFANEYRDLRHDELMDAIFAWTDASYQRKNANNRELIASKQAPFYSISELHMIYPMDERLFNLLAPNFTVAPTSGINVNTMKEEMLRALVPQMTKEESEAFFKFRDSEEEDNQFKSIDDFYTYLKNKIAAFRNDQQKVDEFKNNIEKQNIRLVTDESNFKITVQAKVGQATKLLEAWVTLDPNNQQQKQQQSNNTQTTPTSNGTQAAQPKTAASSGLKITFMRIL